MEPAPATEDPLATNPPPSTGTGTAPPRKTRSDAKLEQLSPARRERLRVWLEDENRPYAEVVALLRAEFNLTVGKSAVALYWRRHLMPQQHEAEAEIAAAIAALPAADFDLATLNQARALAWTALARPQPQVQDAAILLAAIHRAERLNLARQRLALEDRRVALREAQAALEGDGPQAAEPKALYRARQRDISHKSSSDDASNGKTPAPSDPYLLATHQTLPTTTSSESGLLATRYSLLATSFPRFPGYSGLIQPLAGHEPQATNESDLLATHYPLLATASPFSPSNDAGCETRKPPAFGKNDLPDAGQGLNVAGLSPDDGSPGDLQPSTHLPIMPIAVGSKAPDFTLKTKAADGLKDIKLSDNFGKKQTVLLFFPAAFTSVCTTEMCDQSNGLAEYEKLGAQVYAISVDNAFSQEAWAKASKITLPILSDLNKTVTKAYDVVFPNLAGIGDTSARAAFVIGQDGVVKYAEQTPTPKDLPNFGAVKAALAK